MLNDMSELPYVTNLSRSGTNDIFLNLWLQSVKTGVEANMPLDHDQIL